jgi:EmrB/QacA subfamily drug resistance transporter
MTSATTRRSKLLAVFGLLLTIFLVSLDQTIVGTAMPRIIADLRGFELYALVTTSYLLAQTAVIPIAGKLGDMYGRKWVSLSGVILFLLSSWLCGFAPNMWWLILARGAQGIGAGAIFSTVFTLIADIFPDATQRARYQGFFFAVFSLSSVIGPIVGGTITDTLGWRWVFYVNVPVGVLSLVLLPFVLPTTARHSHGRIDVPGALVSTIGVIALMLAFTWVGEGQAVTAPNVMAGFVIFVLALALFIPIELRAAEPIIPFSLFRNRVVAVVTVMMFMSSVVMFGIILYTPLYLQGVAGQSASVSGAALIPLVLTMTLVSIVGGQIISRVGHVRPFLLFGAVVVTAGAALLTTLDLAPTLGLIGAYMFVVGLGLGLLLPNSTLAVQTSVEPRHIGVATSATQFIRSIGATIGTAFMGTLVASGYAGNLNANLPAGTTPALTQAIKNPDALVSPDALNALAQAANGVPDGARLTQDLLHAARQALAAGVHQGFLMVALAGGLLIVAAILLPHLNLKQRRVTVEVELEGLSSVPAPGNE